MQFNDLYCLARPEVHTLSIGAARPSDFDPHIKALEHYDRAAEVVEPIEARLRAEMKASLGEGLVRELVQRHPQPRHHPNQINVMEIMRLWTYAKSIGIVEWAKMRYNLLGQGRPLVPWRECVTSGRNRPVRQPP